MMRVLLSTLLLTLGVAAQTITADVPNLPPTNVDLPFPQGISRYQQWFSPNALTSFPEPMRFQQLEFVAGTGNSLAPAQVDINCQVLIGHGKFSGAFGAFDTNWDETPITVHPMGNVTLTNVPAGQTCMTIPFVQRFQWDKLRPILIEIRTFGNSLGNGNFTFFFAGTTTSFGQVARVFAGGNVGAASGQTAQGSGMVARLTARQGSMLPFGAGCAGEGGITPEATTDVIASPGIVWTHELSMASSQRLAVWTIGYAPGSSVLPQCAAFPVNLSPLFNLPGTCLLYPCMTNAISTMTVGGGAGSGIATMQVPLPAVTSYIGLHIYTQWVVFDPLSWNGGIATSRALWTIVAPVGG